MRGSVADADPCLPGRAIDANAEARPRTDGTKSSIAECVEGNGLRELGAEPIASGPFDHGICTVSATRPDQPDPDADIDVPVGDGHDAALRDVEDRGVDAAGAQLAHRRLKLDGRPSAAAPVRI